MFTTCPEQGNMTGPLSPMCNSFLFKINFIEVELHRTKCAYLNSESFDNCVNWHHHHLKREIGYFHHPKKCPIAPLLSILPPLPPGNTPDLLCDTID